jgi:hypothetical protein
MNDAIAFANKMPTGFRDGAVIEIEHDGEAVTALVLLAGDESVILDMCDGSTPIVVRYDELASFRVFEPELLDLAAA